MLRRLFFGAAGLALCAVAATAALHPVWAADDSSDQAPAEIPVPPFLNAGFSFHGPFGMIDKASAQRGLQIYKEVCSNCHGLYELSYRNIAALGYTEDEVKAFAAQYEVDDFDDKGQPTKRKAKPSDRFVRPFPNEAAARDANNGALPPDLALIAKSRAGGPDYVYSLVQGYDTTPAGFKLGNGLNFNKFFPGHQIAMPQPLQDGSVTFADGTPNTLPQEAKDVATFLEWAAEPEADERKQTGLWILIFLAPLVVILYAVKRRVWSDLH
jgi:ubiquinol-cytochrome c reductase cytochrome c1 subunit